MLCHDDSDCSWPAMSVCRDDGTNEGTTRCQCAPGYQQYSARNGEEQEELLCGIIQQLIALFVEQFDFSG